MTLDLNGSSRAAFETLGGKTGIHINFDKRFQETPMVPLSLKDVSVLDALDFVSLQTHNFWQMVDSTTIMVAPDTTGVRIALQPTAEKVIPLSNVQSPTAILEIVTAVRTMLNIRNVGGNAKGIVLNDTAVKIALVEQLVAALDRIPSR